MDKDQLAMAVILETLNLRVRMGILTPANAKLEALEAYRQYCEYKKVEVNQNIVKRAEQ